MEGGRAARKKANIKVRQPLSEIKIYETNTDIAEFIKRQEDIILDELNIKRITITDTLEEMGSFTIKPNFKILSSKFGDDMQDAIKDISKMDTYKTMYNYLKNEKLPSENFDIINEDIIPEIKGKEGYESFFSNIIIVEKSKTALDHAMPLGGDEGVLIDGNEVERIMELTNGKGAEAVIDFVGEKGSTSMGLNMTGGCGYYYIVGYGEEIKILAVDVIIAEKNIVGNLVGTWSELYELMELANKGLVKLSMQEYKLDDANKALHDLNDGKVKGRAVLVP